MACSSPEYALKYDHTTMSAAERVTVTLPGEVVREIDRMEKNRSRFVFEAVKHELSRRRRAALRRSLHEPHPETVRFEDAGLEEWARSLPVENAADLVDPKSGAPIRWVRGKGWMAGRR